MAKAECTSFVLLDELNRDKSNRDKYSDQAMIRTLDVSEESAKAFWSTGDVYTYAD